MKTREITLLAGAMIATIGTAGCAGWHDRAVPYASTSVDGGHSDAAWALLDSNHDDSLSWQELSAEKAMGLQRDFGNADSNHDGRVSREEWNRWWPRMTRTPASPTMARLNGTDVADSRRSDETRAAPAHLE